MKLLQLFTKSLFYSGYNPPSDISHSVYTTSLNPLLKMYKPRTFKRHLNKISEDRQLARDEIGEFTRKKRKPERCTRTRNLFTNCSFWQYTIYSSLLTIKGSINLVTSFIGNWSLVFESKRSLPVDQFYNTVFSFRFCLD